MTAINSTNTNWHTLCQKDDLVKHSGVCALLDNEQQVAIFLIDNDKAFTISNWDPAGNANVLYRGLIGDEEGEIFVASPLYKERFVLSDGRCLDDESLSVTSYATRIEQGQVQVLV
ncbi:nitrite reductase small subunit NirD [Thalassotalea psychrophila]|uniref:Nitrite reductase small subunit NirD n=1 Tax=Thalassotalea psychrophila TaxID=3065647 RepID=A0ABY9TVJ1_9GAMM|nr:nitrite reductase small subunit NirD [Colwelliaceae bacterium SQ149]